MDDQCSSPEVSTADISREHPFNRRTNLMRLSGDVLGLASC